MTKIAWLVDTAAGFTAEEIKRYPLYVVPMGVIINGQHYTDQVDLSTEKFYELLSRYGEGAKTTQPNFQAMLETYQRIAHEGYDAVIAVHPSSELTGSYQNSVAAGSEVDIKSAAIDSRTGSFPYKKMVLTGIEAVEDGATFEEAVTLVEQLSEKGMLYLQPKSMQQMRKSGRVTASQSFLAGVLNINVILLLKDGFVKPFDKVRTKKKVMERLLNITREAIREENLSELSVVYAGETDEADKYVEALRSEFPAVRIHMEPLVPVAGVHTGYGTVGIGWLNNK